MLFSLEFSLFTQYPAVCRQQLLETSVNREVIKKKCIQQKDQGLESAAWRNHGILRQCGTVDPDVEVALTREYSAIFIFKNSCLL